MVDTVERTRKCYGHYQVAVVVVCMWREEDNDNGGMRRGSDWEDDINIFLIVLGGPVKRRYVGTAVLIIWRRIKEKR